MSNEYLQDIKNFFTSTTIMKMRIDDAIFKMEYRLTEFQFVINYNLNFY